MFSTSRLWCSLPWWIHCLLACSLVCESTVEQFLTFINFARQANICGERFSVVEENKKCVFKNVSQQTLVTFHLSLYGQQTFFSELTSTLKTANLHFETRAAQSYNYLKRLALFGFLLLSFFDEQAQALSAYCHYILVQLSLAIETHLLS